jgi:hypothetical protein
MKARRRSAVATTKTFWQHVLQLIILRWTRIIGWPFHSIGLS